MARAREEASADELRLLAFLRGAAPGPRSLAVASNAEVAEALGRSVPWVKLRKKSMVDRGLIEVHERRAANGAQMENAYRLTRKARKLLAAKEAEQEPAG